MIELIIALALGGSAIAGIWDLKTTEVPDPLPVGMVAVGAGYWIVNWLLTGDSYSLVVSLAVGTALLAVGLLLYRRGQWGGADAWILAAIGYMVPVYAGQIFIVPFIFNFMLVSIAYTVVYSLAVGAMNPSVFRHVRKDFAANRKILAGIPLAVITAILAVSLAVSPIIYLAYGLVPLVVLLVLFWRYALVIERRVFRKKISSGKLKVGDVLEKGNWVGLTEKQIKQIRREKRFVVIKDGMRFVPVFPITLALTLLYGNLFFIIF